MSLKEEDFQPKKTLASARVHHCTHRIWMKHNGWGEGYWVNCIPVKRAKKSGMIKVILFGGDPAKAQYQPMPGIRFRYIEEKRIEKQYGF